MKKGEDVIINKLVIIKRPELMILGNHVAIDDFVYITPKFIAGDYIHVCSFVSVIGGDYGSLTLGNFVSLASGSRIICAGDNWINTLLPCVVPIEYRDVPLSGIILEDFCGVATNSIVFPNVTMARGSVLGANSMLKENTEPWGIYVGNPAKLVGYRNKEKILNDAKKLGYE